MCTWSSSPLAIRVGFQERSLLCIRSGWTRWPLWDVFGQSLRQQVANSGGDYFSQKTPFPMGSKTRVESNRFCLRGSKLDAKNSMIISMESVRKIKHTILVVVICTIFMGFPSPFPLEYRLFPVYSGKQPNKWFHQKIRLAIIQCDNRNHSPTTWNQWWCASPTTLEPSLDVFLDSERDCRVFVLEYL